VSSPGCPLCFLDWLAARADLGDRWITTDRDGPVEPDFVVVKSYGQVLQQYRLQPEDKFNGPDGKPYGRNTTGILHRRPVHILNIWHIGKEANKLDEGPSRPHRQPRRRAHRIPQP